MSIRPSFSRGNVCLYSQSSWMTFVQRPIMSSKIVSFTNKISFNTNFRHWITISIFRSVENAKRCTFGLMIPEKNWEGNREPSIKHLRIAFSLFLWSGKNFDSLFLGVKHLIFSIWTGPKLSKMSIDAYFAYFGQASDFLKWQTPNRAKTVFDKVLKQRKGIKRHHC